MSYSFTLEDLKKEYHTQYGDASVTVDRMIKAINDSRFPSDWLRYKSLKRACKKFGITKSGELREFVKQSFEKIEKENVACVRCDRKTMPLFPNFVCIDCATSEELERYGEVVTE
jgi:hypothetical protein